jgi:hypothetical protein
MSAIRELSKRMPDGGGLEKEKAAALEYITTMLKDAVVDRSRFDPEWAENSEFRHGKHWSHEASAGRSRPVINLCSKVIRASTPVLVENRPTLDVMPRHPDHFVTADLIHAGASWVLDQNRFHRSLSKEMVTSQEIGCSFYEVVYDPDMDFQRGGVAVRPKTPWDVLAIGGEDVQECEMVAIRRRMPLKRLRRLFGSVADKVRPDWDISTASVRPKLAVGGSGRQTTTIRGSSRTDTYRTGPNDEISAYKEQYQEAAWMWEVYFRDEETIKVVEEMMEERGSAWKRAYRMREKLKYPNGWRMITLAGNTILADNPLPYKHARVPLVKLSNLDVPGEFWPESDLRQLKIPNKIINLLLGQIIDNLRIGNNPPLLVPMGSGLNINNWANWPGIVAQFTPNNSGAPHWMKPIDINPQVIQVIQMCMSYIYEISGMSEVSEGGLVKNASGELYAQMREAALNRIRLKVQNLDDMIGQLGEQVVGLMQQFWDSYKMLRVTGLMPEEQLQRLPGIVLDQQGRAAFLPVNKPQAGSGGQMFRFNDIRDGQYEVKCRMGSTVAESRRQLIADTLAMKREGIYNAEDVVIRLDDPRKDQVIARQRAMEAMQMQMAQAQMGGGAPPGAAPPESGGPPGAPPPDGGATERMPGKELATTPQ